MTDITPTRIDLKVTRRTSPRIRVTIYEGNNPADLTGDTLTFVAKTKAGGTVKLNETMTLEPQSGTTKGQATVVLPEAKLRADGTPNDSLTDPVEWPYQVRRIHAGLPSVPIDGTLTLAETI
jgi:hypothetical protein